MTTNPQPSGTKKVRRVFLGSKRAEGRQLQSAGNKVQRPNPERIAVRRDDSRLTSVAGLVDFGKFLAQLGLARRLKRDFGHLKSHPATVYPMAAQLQLLIDANVAGEGRVFGLEHLAADPLFVTLAGGHVPSIDVLYDDLARFGPEEIAKLEQLVCEGPLAQLQTLQPTEIDVDIDTTVEPLFGHQEGAVPGPNPNYRGRPSYHPIFAYCRQAGGVVGARLRPGDTAFGVDDVPAIIAWLARLRAVVGPDCCIRVRVDAAGDCAALLAALQKAGAFYVIKAKPAEELMKGLLNVEKWETVEADADGTPTLQVAEVQWQRPAWRDHKIAPRVVAVRTTERFTGRQMRLWEGLDFTVQAYITNDRVNPPDLIQASYDQRAGIEPIIAELKGGWGIGKVPTKFFDANHAAMLLKMLAYNLFQKFITWFQGLIPNDWRTAWARRALICRAGRLAAGPGRTLILHTAPIRCCGSP